MDFLYHLLLIEAPSLFQESVFSPAYISPNYFHAFLKTPYAGTFVTPNGLAPLLRNLPPRRAAFSDFYNSCIYYV